MRYLLTNSARAAISSSVAAAVVLAAVSNVPRAGQTTTKPAAKAVSGQRNLTASGWRMFLNRAAADARWTSARRGGGRASAGLQHQRQHRSRQRVDVFPHAT